MLGVESRKNGGDKIYGFNYSGGKNRTHGQIETTPRIDSFQLGQKESDGILFAGRILIDFDRFTEYGPGDIDREYVYLCGGRWKLRLVRIHNGFGGGQSFWLCPHCLRRVRFLYFIESDLMCRECAGLNYRSQQQTKDSMFWYWKGVSFAEEKLALSPDLRPDGFDFCEYIPEKPKGMHATTYSRYLSRFLKYRDRHIARTMADMKKFIGPDGWMELMNIMDGK